ncbi:hypothetical protein [Saccharopolyspora sp. NPDC002376]
MTRAECIAAAGNALARARARRDSLPPRQAAELAHYAGGPSVDEIERQIRAQRGLSAAA